MRLHTRVLQGAGELQYLTGITNLRLLHLGRGSTRNPICALPNLRNTGAHRAEPKLHAAPRHCMLRARASVNANKRGHA